MLKIILIFPLEQIKMKRTKAKERIGNNKRDSKQQEERTRKINEEEETENSNRKEMN